jgi:hypothetical protein
LSSSPAVYTTVFPNAMPYLRPFVRSLLAQSDRDWALWVGLDRLDPEDVRAAAPEIDELEPQWITAQQGDRPAILRERAWCRIVEQHDIVVLVDSDDVLATERVAAAVAGLVAADVYGCALELIEGSGASLGAVLQAPPVEDWEVFLGRKNVFGLSNTAYRTAVLADVLPLPVDVGVIDWHIASRIADAGGRFVFDPRPLMLYRQYGDNMARVVPPFTGEYLRTAGQLVRGHYELLEPLLRPSGVLAGEVRRGLAAVHRYLARSADRFDEQAEALNARGLQAYIWWDYVE